MDKPISLPVKDYIIRKMAVKMMKDESVISSVISHQFSSFHNALLTNNSVEISGFGKFLFNPKKMMRELNGLRATQEVLEQKLASDEFSEEQKVVIANKLNRCKDAIQNLNQALISHGVDTDMGRMEEQSSAPKEAESIDNQCVQTEAGSM